jgi:hypothetical protein
MSIDQSCEEGVKGSMRGIKIFSLLCAAIIGLGAALGWGLKHSSFLLHSSGAESTKLWIPPDALNMGTIWESEEFAWTVPIDNHELSPIEIQSFGSTCNCLSIEPQSFVLGPGQRRDLYLKIDLTSQVKPTGEVSVGLWPVLKNQHTKPEGPIGPEWQIAGQVRRVLKFDRRIYLGQHSELAQPLPVRSIPIEVLVPLVSLSAKSDLAGFSAKVERLEGAKTIVHLSSVTKRDLGAFKGTVTLWPIVKGGERLPAQRLEFEGRIVSDVEAVPPVVQVGGRLLGESFEEIVQLRSLTGRALVGVRAEVEGDGLTVECVEAGQRYRIRQEVSSLGTCTNRARFSALVSGHKVDCMVPVSYTGVASN